MTIRSHGAFRVDIRIDDGEMVEHVPGEDLQLAMKAYRAAVKRWPGAAVTLSQGGRVIEDSHRGRLAIFFHSHGLAGARPMFKPVARKFEVATLRITEAGRRALARQ